MVFGSKISQNVEKTVMWSLRILYIPVLRDSDYHIRNLISINTLPRGMQKWTNSQILHDRGFHIYDISQQNFLSFT